MSNLDEQETILILAFSTSLLTIFKQILKVNFVNNETFSGILAVYVHIRDEKQVQKIFMTHHQQDF